MKPVNAQKKNRPPIVTVRGGVAEILRGVAYIVDFDDIAAGQEECAECGAPMHLQPEREDTMGTLLPVDDTTDPPSLLMVCPAHGTVRVEITLDSFGEAQ